MKTTRLFRNVWRANAVIIFGAGVVVLILGLIAGYYMLREMTRERVVETVIDTDKSERIEQSFGLGAATQIAGHPWLLVPMESDQHYDRGSFSKDASSVRNYAFVSGLLETRWLYPHSRFLIIDATQLPRGDYEGESNATRLVSFEVVQQDTDGDKRLTSADASDLVFSRPDGTGVTTVLESVTQIVSQELMGEEVVVVYKDRDGYAAASYSLKDFAPVKREHITLPPSGT